MSGRQSILRDGTGRLRGWCIADMLCLRRSSELRTRSAPHPALGLDVCADLDEQAGEVDAPLLCNDVQRRAARLTRGVANVGSGGWFRKRQRATARRHRWGRKSCRWVEGRTQSLQLMSAPSSTSPSIPWGSSAESGVLSLATPTASQLPRPDMQAQARHMGREGPVHASASPCSASRRRRLSWIWLASKKPPAQLSVG